MQHGRIQIILRTVLMLVATGGMASTPDGVDPRAWEELDIVPMPKEIRLTDADLALDPERVTLVLGADPGRQSQIGAEWINRRLVEVGGAAPLPVTAHMDAPEGGTLVIIGTREDNPLIAAAVRSGLLNVGENNPGERGYEIRRSADGRRVYLAGADPLGALYACVTFGELLDPRAGVVAWRAADVRDWPDLIWLTAGQTYSVGNNGLPEHFDLFRRIRFDSNPSPELEAAYAHAIRAHTDHLLRRKFTLIHYSSYRLLGEPFEPVRGTEIVRAGIDYGRERGIEAILFAEQPFAGRRARYPEVAASRVCPVSSGPHAYDRVWLRCWSLDDLTRETARNLAGFIEASGITHVGLHDTDTGWYTNPAQWDERCDVCRARWGDDYAAATINKHRIYYEAIKERNPDARVHLTLYPYGTPILVPGMAEDMYAARFGDTPSVRAQGRDASAHYREFWERMHDAFPANDVTFAVREAPEEAIQAFRSVTPGRGLFTWFGLMSHAWRPLFSEAAVWSGTFVDHPNDLFGVVAYLDNFVPMEAWAVREYSWNTATPGARPWDRGTLEWGRPGGQDAEQWRHAEPHGEVYTRVLPRLARNYFGRQAGPYIAQALEQNIDLQQIFDRQRRPYTWLTDHARMQWQADNAARAADALDALWSQVAADPARLGMDAFTLRRVINLRERVRMGMWAARARAQNMLAHERASDQDRDGAETAIARGLEYCRQARIDAERLLAERPGDEVLEAEDFNRWAGLWRTDMADQADFTFIEERLRRSEEDLPGLIAWGAIPEDVMARLARRGAVRAHRVEVARMSMGPDGNNRLRQAMPVETLLVLGSEAHPARAQTRARLLYDDARLVLAVDCWPVGDRPVDDRDLVEIFLSPDDDGDYVHFFIDASGRLRQQYNAIEEHQGVRRAMADNEWKGQGVEHAVERGPDRWTAFLSVPSNAFGARIGAGGWRINIARVYPLNGQEFEVSSIQTPGAQGLHDREYYPALVWAEEPHVPLSVYWNAPEFRVATMTLPDTIASVAVFRLEVEADRVLHEAHIEAELYDKEGRLQRRQTLAHLPQVPYRWASPGELAVEYPAVYAQGGIRLLLTSPDGDAEHWLRFGGWEGTPESGSIYDRTGEGRMGLRAPAYLPDHIAIADGEDVAWFHGAEGTVEFWFTPGRDWPEKGPETNAATGTRTLVHYGPNRPHHPAAVNNAPLSIQFVAPAGRLYARLLNHQFAGWIVHADVTPWPAGARRHVAVVWDAAAPEQDRVRMYVDGQRRSSAPSYQNRDRLPTPVISILDTSTSYPLQIGSLNNGMQRMEGILDGLDVSRRARYHNDFEPPGMHEDPEAGTALRLPLDATLKGIGRCTAGNAHPVQAVPGSAW